MNTDDPQDQTPPADLNQEIERLKVERDKAVSARDFLVREMLAGGRPEQEASRSRRRGLMWVIGLVLLGGLLFAMLHMSRTSKQLQMAARLAPSEAVPKLRMPAPRAVARQTSSRRLSVIPITEVDLLSRAAVAPSGRLVALGGLDGKVALFDLTRDSVRLLQAHKPRGGVRDLVFSRDGTRLLTAGADGAVYSWVVSSGARHQTFRPPGRPPVRGLAICGQSLAVAAEQPEVELISVRGKVRRLTGHQSWVRAVTCTTDGKRLASGGHDGKIRVWSTESGELSSTLKGHGLWVSALAFSPDGKRLASGGFDRRVRLWDVPTGRQLRKLWGHVRWVSALAFDRTGKLLASASVDRTVRVWAVNDGTSRAHLSGHRRGIHSVAFLPGGGHTVLSASGDGTVRLWPHPIPTPQARRKLGPVGPGELTLRSYSAGERLRVRVLDGAGNVLESGRRELAWIMRSSTDDRAAPPKPKLVKLLYKIAERFGRKREITFISGYRSPEYNALRTRQSRQVGKESRHMKGEAMDIRIEGVPITRLHKYLRKLRPGGVGFYPDSQFVHVDIGPVRFWKGD